MDLSTSQLEAKENRFLLRLISKRAYLYFSYTVHHLDWFTDAAASAFCLELTPRVGTRSWLLLSYDHALTMERARIFRSDHLCSLKLGSHTSRTRQAWLNCSPVTLSMIRLIHACVVPEEVVDSLALQSICKIRIQHHGPVKSWPSRTLALSPQDYMVCPSFFKPSSFSFIVSISPCQPIHKPI